MGIFLKMPQTNTHIKTHTHNTHTHIKLTTPLFLVGGSNEYKIRPRRKKLGHKFLVDKIKILQKSYSYQS